MWWSKEPGTMIKTLSDLLVLSICPVLLCGPLEETSYRGYLLTATLQRERRVWLAFTINAFVFASIHYAFGPGVMLFILLWTYIPCWLYYRSGSIYPSILFHSLNNLLAYVMLPLLFTLRKTRWDQDFHRLQGHLSCDHNSFISLYHALGFFS